MMRIAITLGLLLPLTAAQACGDCRWTALPECMQLGEALELSVSRPLDDAGPKLAELPLDLPDTDFEVFERIAGEGGGRQDLRLVLYPRRSGTLMLDLPGLDRHTIEVRDDGFLHASFTWRAEPQHWTLRRANRLELEVCGPGALRWSTPQPRFSSGLTLLPLSLPDAASGRDPRSCVPQRWVWSATPSRAGEFRIDLGMLEASRHGHRLRFPIPAFVAAVSPVPAWLPNGIAVGEPKVTHDALPEVVPAGQPLQWRLQLQAGYSEATLAALIDAQLSGNSAWARYPARIEALRTDSASPAWTLTLTALPERHGTLALPRLVLPWFDAAEGVLRQTTLETMPTTVRDPLREGTILVLYLLGVALLLALSAWLLCRPVHAWRAHRRLLARLAAARNAGALHEALVGADAPTTVRSWARSFLATHDAPGLAALAGEVDALRFGRAAATDFASVQQRLLDCLRQARPLGVRKAPSGAGR